MRFADIPAIRAAWRSSPRNLGGRQEPQRASAWRKRCVYILAAMPPIVPPHSEKRRLLRARSFRRARCVFNAGGSTLDVTLRDISPTGARISGDGLIGLPRSFEVQILDGFGGLSPRDAGAVWTEAKRPASSSSIDRNGRQAARPTPSADGRRAGVNCPDLRYRRQRDDQSEHDEGPNRMADPRKAQQPGRGDHQHACDQRNPVLPFCELDQGRQSP